MAARALAARRPMAAAAVGGLAEIVRPGETGELFPPGDPAALAEAVLRVLEGGGASYERGLAAAAERASWKSYGDALLEFIGQVRKG
jgi:glycogen(starch) synthase